MVVCLFCFILFWFFLVKGEGWLLVCLVLLCFYLSSFDFDKGGGVVVCLVLFLFLFFW